MLASQRRSALCSLLYLGFLLRTSQKYPSLARALRMVEGSSVTFWCLALCEVLKCTPGSCATQEGGAPATYAEIWSTLLSYRSSCIGPWQHLCECRCGGSLRFRSSALSEKRGSPRAKTSWTELLEILCPCACEDPGMAPYTVSCVRQLNCFLAVAPWFIFRDLCASRQRSNQKGHTS